MSDLSTYTVQDLMVMAESNGSHPECSQVPTAAITKEIDRRILELEEIIAKHDLCHNLHGKVDARSFADGCAAEQRKLYGEAPDCDRAKELEEAVRVLAEECWQRRESEGRRIELLLFTPGSVAFTAASNRLFDAQRRYIVAGKTTDANPTARAAVEKARKA